MPIAKENFERDRRSSHRHSVKTALRVRVWNSGQPEHRAESVNVSLRGIYFNTKTPLCEGEIVEVLLKMPEEVSGEETTEWRCTGHVARVDQFDAAEGKLGVGVQFYCYEAARPEQARLPLATGPSWRVTPYAEPRHAARSAGGNGMEAIFKDMERSSQKGVRTNRGSKETSDECVPGLWSGEAR